MASRILLMGALELQLVLMGIDSSLLATPQIWVMRMNLLCLLGCIQLLTLV